MLVKVKDDVEVGILESAFNLLVCHHDAFRLSYRMETKELFYNQNNYNKKIKIESFDLSELSKTEQSIRIASIGEILKSSFNIENEILLKVCIFDLGDFGKRLLMTAHHLAVDGISWRIIFEDINQLYKQIENKQKTSLPPKDNSVQDWAIELKRMSKKIPESEKRYWEHVYQYEENSFHDFDL
nr:condensation domain-containing protein [Bacillus pacificus]